MYAKVSITNFTKKANCLIIELWHERTKKAKAELNPHRTPIQMPLTRISKNLIEIFMRSNFAMKFSALLQMVETLILTSSKSYVDIIDQKYNIFRAYGYLLANVEDFCRQKNNSTTYEVNVGDIINTIQEDIYNPGALLAVVISSSKTSKPNSRLLRIHRNGDREWVDRKSVV